MPQNDDHDQ
jgi:hypothetical protein